MLKKQFGRDISHRNTKLVNCSKPRICKRSKRFITKTSKGNFTRTRKVRILNGAHAVLVPVAYLHGLRTVREAVEDIEIGTFIRKAIFDEIIPTLDLPSDALLKFANDVVERFLNPFVRHELTAIALKFNIQI